MYFANPAVKGHLDHVSGPWTNEHLVFYTVSTNAEFLELVVVDNQLEIGDIDLMNTQYLAVPSVKVSYELVL